MRRILLAVVVLCALSTVAEAGPLRNLFNKVRPFKDVTGFSSKSFSSSSSGCPSGGCPTQSSTFSKTFAKTVTSGSNCPGGVCPVQAAPTKTMTPPKK